MNLNTNVAHNVIDLTCPKCGGDILVTTNFVAESSPIGSIGLSIIFDNPEYIPPEGWLPDEIRCKLCKTVYGS